LFNNKHGQQTHTQIHDENENDSEIILPQYESSKDVRSRPASASAKSIRVRESITKVRLEPIVNENRPFGRKLARKTNIERRKKSKKSTKKLRRKSPVETNRATAKPLQLEKDIEMTKKWKDEFIEQENRKVMGEKSFRIKKTEEQALKLQELDELRKQMRSSWVKTDQRHFGVRKKHAPVRLEPIVN